VASFPIEQDWRRGGWTLWFQLYAADTEEKNASWWRKAVAAGCRAIALTVDVSTLPIAKGCCTIETSSRPPSRSTVPELDEARNSPAVQHQWPDAVCGLAAHRSTARVHESSSSAEGILTAEDAAAAV